MFSRTAAGLGNEHLFHGVDLIVYCEGNASEESGGTLDEVFWTLVLRKLNLSCKVKSVGSGACVTDLLPDLIAAGIKNVLLCSDADYRRFKNEAIDHPLVIYTYGYSWESDAVAANNIFYVANLFYNAPDIVQLDDQLCIFKQSLAKTLSRICLMDLHYIDSRDQLFDRKKPQSIVICGHNAPPRLNVQKLLDKAAEIDHVPLYRIDYRLINGWTNFFGKVVAKLLYHWFCWISRPLLSARKVNYNTFLGALAASLEEDDNEMWAHYRRSVERLVHFSNN